MAIKRRETNFFNLLGILRSFILGGNGQAGGPATQVQLTKLVTGIADNVATAIFTVTVPNLAMGAMIELSLLGSLGAGGAVGAFESSNVAFGMIAVARTPGLSAVATAIALTNTGLAAVAGAAVETLAYAVTAMTGANNATQTFQITVTIHAATGSSTNHQLLAAAALTNNQKNGVTIS